jgi:pimeloyl-ACP methyl ester carboxylesterase
MEELYHEVVLPEGVENIKQAQKLPVIMVHGAWHTMAYYKKTPDGREGWAEIFAKHGYPVILVNLLGRGGSTVPDDFLSMPTSRHSVALNRVIEQFGDCIVLSHSMSGQITWKAVDLASPDVKAHYKAIVAVTPTRPGNLVKEEYPQMPETQPATLSNDMIKRMLTNAPKFPNEVFDEYAATLIGESPRAINTFNSPALAQADLSVSSEKLLQDIPTLLLTTELDKATPAKKVLEIAEFFGKHATMVDQDWGLLNHAHMLMIEHGSEIIAAKIIDWLDANVSR